MKALNVIYKLTATLLICIIICTCAKSVLASETSDNYAQNEELETTKNENSVITGSVLPVINFENIGVLSTTINKVVTDNVSELNRKSNTDTQSKNDSGTSTKEKVNTETVVKETKTEVVEKPVTTNIKSSYVYTSDDVYELAKIIMCEAEGESQQCKEYVGQVILNRVKSKKFPNTIHGVIFQGKQFSPTFDGRWEKVEPNQACYDAAYKVINSSEPLTSALYFEACKSDSWHSRNLTKVAEISNTRFYK